MVSRILYTSCVRLSSSSSQRDSGCLIPIYSFCIRSRSPKTEVREYLLSSLSLLASFSEYGPLDWYLRLESSTGLEPGSGAGRGLESELGLFVE